MAPPSFLPPFLSSSIFPLCFRNEVVVTGFVRGLHVDALRRCGGAGGRRAADPWCSIDARAFPGPGTGPHGANFARGLGQGNNSRVSGPEQKYLGIYLSKMLKPQHFTQDSVIIGNFRKYRYSTSLWLRVLPNLPKKFWGQGYPTRPFFVGPRV